MRPRIIFPLLFLAVLGTRLCHLRILWAEEQLPLATALQMLHGKAIYRDVWFDKPPLVAGAYLLWGAQMGWLLRVAGALFVTLACLVAYRFARELWSEREGWLAAGLLTFFLTFGLPAAVMPLAADLFMLLPHLAAVYLAWRRRPLAAGFFAGIAMLFNAKAALVLVACALWSWERGRPRPPSSPASVTGGRGRALSQRAVPLAKLLLGFAIPNLAAMAWFAIRGSLHDYIQQAWQWGSLYAGTTFLEKPWQTGLLRTANWMGFHVALVLGVAWFLLKDRQTQRWRFAGWAVLSFAGVVLGLRFFPRYYFQVLPVFALAAARGYSLLPRKWAIALLSLTLLVPFVRFGPRYALLARDLIAGRAHSWSDVVMYQDSQEAAQRLRWLAGPGDRLFVWGYRPDLYVYSGLPAATRFLESQPLSGVFADRHLFQSGAVSDPILGANRRELVRSRPELVVDGIGPYNPSLAISNYPDLREWLGYYEVISRTKSVVIYRLGRFPVD